MPNRRPQLVLPNGNSQLQPAPSWERRPAETDPAFEALEVYRSTGIKRSCARVGQQLRKSRTLMTRWSQRYDWVERVAPGPPPVTHRR
jgi:hypothetical protein